MVLNTNKPSIAIRNGNTVVHVNDAEDAVRIVLALTPAHGTNRGLGCSSDILYSAANASNLI